MERSGTAGSAMKGGWIRLSRSSQLFGVPESWLIQAVEADAGNVKPRLQLSEDRTRVRAFCGHSADLGIADAGAVYEEAEVSSLRELRLSPFSDMWHGTDLERCRRLQLRVASRRRFTNRAAHCPLDGRKETV